MIRVAVIGAGHWGPNLIRNFHAQGPSQVRYVVDSRPERLKQLEGRYPDVTFTTDLARALGDPEVDAVVVSTPTATHAPICRAALEAKKHVLVEKPITHKAEDAVGLERLAQQQGRVLMVGHVFLFNPAVQYVKRLIDEGALGKLQYLSMVRTNLGPIRGDVSAAWDLASHDVSIADYWLSSAPVAVSAVGGVFINPGVHDVTFATLRYPSGVLVNLHTSWLNPRKARDITVVGDRRMLTFDDMNLLEPVRLYDKGVKDDVTPSVVDTFAGFRASVREGDITIPKVAMGEPLKTECDHFLECVRTGARPLTDAARATAVVRTLEALDQSIARGGAEVRP